MKDEITLENLKIWVEARNFRKTISELVKGFPLDEKYRLSDQLLRSSRSIAANIAEGHGRYHYQENIQYCRHARGSLVEVYDHLTCALDETLISVEIFNNLAQDYLRIHKMINGYIAYLARRKQGE